MSATPLNVPATDKAETVITSKDNVRDAAGIDDTVSLSSEHFNFVSLEESGVVDSIGQVNQLFTIFTKKSFTLEEALVPMGYEKAKELVELLTKKAEEKIKEFDAPGLTVEDITAIFCYTFEWDKERFGEGESPYRKLNNSLSVDRSNAALKKTRGFLFLLLQALRKLPRFVPEDHILYRGLRTLVQTEPDPEFPERKPYAAGNEKTWWAFTSTTTSLEATQEFLGDRESTLFVVSGNPWGYDISVFSDFPEEKEILLEPERKLRVTSVSREGQLITVNAEMLDTPLVLEKVVKVSKRAKEVKVRKSKVKEVPKDLKAENVTSKAVGLSWTPVEVKDKEVKYQVVMKKAGFFNRSKVIIYEGTETKCSVDNLEQWTEYEFQSRCGYEGGWGKWSGKTIMKTLSVRLPEGFSWKECPDDVEWARKYSVNEMNPRIATKLNNDYGFCTVTGGTPLPLNNVTSWNIKILRSKNNDGSSIYIGVAPSDINQNEGYNYNSCGWYFYCYDSTLFSGPPHNYKEKKYGPRKGEGKYAQTGGSVGVVMDTIKGELSFAVNGVNHGVAFYVIPLDKPLVPCAIFWYKGDSVELII